MRTSDIEVTSLALVRERRGKKGRIMAIASVRLPALGLKINGVKVYKRGGGGRVVAQWPLTKGADNALSPTVTFLDLGLDAAIRAAVVAAYRVRIQSEHVDNQGA